MKYIELITNAYRLRNVIDTTQAPDAEQGVAAVALLNQLMAELLADGVDLQYVPVTSSQVGDTIGLPVWAEGGITAALALRVVAGGAVTLELQRQYDDGMATILRRAVSNALPAASLQHVPAGEAVRRRGDFYSG